MRAALFLVLLPALALGQAKSTNPGGGTATDLNCTTCVSTGEIADSAVTNAKVDSVATSKLTGTISTAQIADSAVTVGKISATGTAGASTFLRGDGTWNAPAAGVSETLVSLTSPVTLVAGSYQDVTGLGHAVAANTTYRFICFLGHRNGGAAASGWSMNGPASPSQVWFSVEVQSALGSYASSTGQFAASYDAAGTVSIGNAGVVIRGFVRNGPNAGTLIPRYNVGAVTSAEIEDGSWCRYF